VDSMSADFGVKVIGSIVALSTAGFAVFTYFKNSRTKAAEFLLTLHKTFFVDSTYQAMKTLLDCDGAEEEAKLKAAVDVETPEFTDFLNFFELVAYLDSIKTLDRADTEALLGYYLNRLREKGPVWAYIRKSSHGFEHLRRLLTERETQ
jgi:hypothetical protein